MLCATVNNFKGRGVQKSQAISERSPSDVRGEGRVFSGGGRAAPAGLVAGVDILGPAAAPRELSPGVMAPRRCVQEQGKGNGEPPGRSRVRSGGVFSRPARSNKPGEGGGGDDQDQGGSSSSSLVGATSSGPGAGG